MKSDPTRSEATHSGPIRIGILGAGGIFRSRHLPGLSSLPEAQVVVVCNRSRASSQAIAEEFGVAEIATDPQEVLARADLEAIMIGTQPYMHCAWSIAALEAGKHVFCQARMARDLAEARRMLRCAQAHPQQVSMLCPAPHVLPGQAFIRQQLAAGALGQLRLVRVQHLSDAALNPAAPWHWRMSREISGYNTLALGMFSEIMHHWVGRARTVSASAVRFTQQRPGADGTLQPTDVPESVAISGQLENGAQYSYTFSALAAGAPPNGIELYGTEASLFYDLQTHQVRRAEVDQTRRVRVGTSEPGPAPGEVPIPPALRGEWQVERMFLDAIRHGRPVFPTFADGVDYMEFTEAALRSAEEGRTLTLPL